MTLDLKGIILLGESLLAIALLMAHRGETYQARKLYELVWRMPRFQRSALYDAIAGKKIRSLTSTLSPEDLNTLVHEAVHRDPWQEATTLFEEMQAASAGS